MRVVVRGSTLTVTCWHRTTRKIDLTEPWLGYMAWLADLNPCKAIGCPRRFVPRKGT